MRVSTKERLCDFVVAAVVAVVSVVVVFAVVFVVGFVLGAGARYAFG